VCKLNIFKEYLKLQAYKKCWINSGSSILV